IMAGPAAVHGEIVGQDALALDEWRQGWEQARMCTTPPGPAWSLLSTLTRVDVLLWLARESTKHALGILTRELLHRCNVDGAEWKRMVARATTGRPVVS